MTAIKAYTDLSQSKKLAEILPIETADMYYDRDGLPSLIDKYVTHESIKNDKYHHLIPCWSLAAMLEQLSYEVCDDDGNSLYLQINKEEDLYQLMYGDTDPYASFESIETDRYEHFVDACVAMIEKLNELNLL